MNHSSSINIASGYIESNFVLQNSRWWQGSYNAPLHHLRRLGLFVVWGEERLKADKKTSLMLGRKHGRNGVNPLGRERGKVSSD
jgi:hypothetical protein